VSEVFILAAEAEPTGGSGFFLLLMLGAFVVLFILPQRKRRKQVESVQSALSVGDEVQTIGGIMGRVVHLDEDSVVLEVESGRLRLARRAIASRNTPDA
jgi:preprotein translocase subunit YajC